MSGPRLAVRAVILDAGRLLVVNAYPGEESDLWCAPGGGAERGQDLAANLRREVAEETGLAVEPGRLLAVSEFHNPADGFHQVDLIYAARLLGPADAAVLRDPAGVVNRLRWVDAAGARGAPLQARQPGAPGLRPRRAGALRSARDVADARNLGALTAGWCRREASDLPGRKCAWSRQVVDHRPVLVAVRPAVGLERAVDAGHELGAVRQAELPDQEVRPDRLELGLLRAATTTELSGL